MSAGGGVAERPAVVGEVHERAMADEVERALRAEFEGITLVGEIDLDVWGPLAEEGLAPKFDRYPVDKVGRLWPRCLVTYLVHQGIHVYEERTFWPNVSLKALQKGSEAGPAFDTALRVLGLPTFDDLEESEGFELHTKHRWVRRIHLHGGLPRNATVAVLDLLASTLRSGARSPGEVVDRWASMDLFPALHSKAAERLFVHTGDFGVQVVDQLLTVLRQVQSGAGALTDVPSHLLDGVQEFLDRPPDTARREAVVAGVRVRLDITRMGPPELVVPPEADVLWTVNGQERGFSSRQREQRFELTRPVGRPAWEVRSDGRGKEMFRRFSSEHASQVVFVFDERGRLHHRGTTLGGLRAHVIVPSGAEVAGRIDERSIGDGWPGHELVTCDLRRREQLSVKLSDGSAVQVPVNTRLDVRLAGDVVDGVTTVDGLPVLAERVALVFAGFVPEPATVTVTAGGRARRLDQLKEREGAFDLAGLLPAGMFPHAEVTVTYHGEVAARLDFARVPGLRFDRPVLAAPAGEVTCVLRTGGGAENQLLTFGDGSTTGRCSVTDGRRTIDLALSIHRLAWAVESPDRRVVMVDNEPFALRLDQLADARLLLHSGGAPVKVMVRGADAIHEEWARRDVHRPEMRSLPLRGFADTARAAAAPRTRLAVTTGPSDVVFEIGVIESRYEPLAVAVEQMAVDGDVLLDVRWTEHQAWPNRVLRVWSDRQEQPVETVPVPDGETAAQVVLDHPIDGRFVVEVAVASGWSAPKRPEVGPGAVSVYVGAPEAGALREAILTGDRRADFDDEVVDRLAPLLADLVSELMGRSDAPAARTALIERIADDPWRAVEVVDELADRFEVGDRGEGRGQLEPMLLELLPALFDFPIREATEAQAVRLEHLWTVAPLVAAALDAVADPASHQRWQDATGVTTDISKSLDRSLDRLVSGIPRSLASAVPPAPGSEWRRPGAGAVSITVANESPEELLGEEAWTAALRQLYAVATTVSARSTSSPVRALARSLRRAESEDQPRWAAIVKRVRARMDALGVDPRWMGDITILACAHLDGAVQGDGTDRSTDVLDGLLMIQRINPGAVRCALLVAAAGIRMLRDAGPLARLVD